MQSKVLWITQVAAVLILLGVCALGLSQITRDSLWDDEAWSVWAAGAPRLSVVLERVQADVHPPLYFLLLHGWMRVTGDSVLALRLPSLWMGLIALAGTFAVGARLFDRRTGLWAMLLLGAAGFLLYYTREARMYTLLLALATLSTYACLVWLKRPTLWRAVIYAVSMAAMLYTHYAGGLVIVTHLLWGMWLGVRSLRSHHPMRAHSRPTGRLRTALLQKALFCVSPVRKRIKCRRADSAPSSPRSRHRAAPVFADLFRSGWAARSIDWRP